VAALISANTPKITNYDCSTKSLVSSGSSGSPSLVPIVGQDEREIVDVERLVLVSEADPVVRRVG
jgi:hypothetical protein